jgi:hypothetical protein
VREDLLVEFEMFEICWPGDLPYHQMSKWYLHLAFAIGLSWARFDPCRSYGTHPAVHGLLAGPAEPCRPAANDIRLEITVHVLRVPA